MNLCELSVSQCDSIVIYQNQSVFLFFFLFRSRWCCCCIWQMHNNMNKQSKWSEYAIFATISNSYTLPIANSTHFDIRLAAKRAHKQNFSKEIFESQKKLIRWIFWMASGSQREMMISEFLFHFSKTVAKVTLVTKYWEHAPNSKREPEKKHFWTENSKAMLLCVCSPVLCE